MEMANLQNIVYYFFIQPNLKTIAIMRIAILDLGTNTFNLLVSEASLDHKLSVIHTAKEAVKLGKGGIHKGIITDEAMARGIKAIENHLQNLKKYKPEKIYAFGTSAIRDARNSKDFIRRVQDRFDIFVHIIPGDREADFIYKGVRQTLEMSQDPVMILDIGGGSNEFIIANNKKSSGRTVSTWEWPECSRCTLRQIQSHKKKSYELEKYFEAELESLFPAVKNIILPSMIGASGTFETFYSLLMSYLMPEKYNEHQ
jgi:exopolyphosphatase / guanosine-5'-triphosphate,3'-diphosphate pyrophosphatase